jgi:hypothetical protein
MFPNELGLFQNRRDLNSVLLFSTSKTFLFIIQYTFPVYFTYIILDITISVVCHMSSLLSYGLIAVAAIPALGEALDVKVLDDKVPEVELADGA